MKKIKGWIKKVIFKLIKSDINIMVLNLLEENGISIDNCCNSKEDASFREEIKFNDFVGYKVEVRHYTQEESIFVNVNAVIDSSSYLRDDKTGEVICNNRKVILIDTDKTMYTLDNIYEYEIRKREVLHK